MGVLQRIVIAIAVLVASGCASLPDFNRIQASMDQMAYYTGVMACNMPIMTGNTSRMADAVERMERKTDSIVEDLKKQGKTMEATVQNYGQSFIDSDRKLIKNLEGIKGELTEMRKTLRPATPPGPGTSKEQDDVNAKLQSKLSELNSRLDEIALQVKKQSASRSALR